MLDVGSNTVHLLVVDAHRGAEPTPQHSSKSQLRLAEHLDPHGDIIDDGADALVEAAVIARDEADDLGCADLLGFATSAVRDAGNSARVLKRVAKEAGVRLTVLSGEDEARLTFLAVRRWFGWSAGNLMSLDIGGGSLELASGRHEDPDVAFSLPLGAARLTREWFSNDPPSRKDIDALRAHVEVELAPAAAFASPRRQQGLPVFGGQVVQGVGVVERVGQQVARASGQLRDQFRGRGPLVDVQGRYG